MQREIGKRIRMLRVAKGWDQEELGHRAGMSGSGIGKLERGTYSPSLSTLEKLARAFGVRVRDLLDEAARIRPAAQDTKLVA